MAAEALQQWCRSHFQRHSAGKRTVIGDIELSCNDIGIFVLGIRPRELAGVTVPKRPALGLAGDKLVQVESSELLHSFDDLSMTTCVSQS